MATHMWSGHHQFHHRHHYLHRKHIAWVCMMCWPVKCFIVEKLKFRTKYRSLLCDTFISINEFCNFFFVFQLENFFQVKLNTWMLYCECVSIFQRCQFIRWFYSLNKCVLINLSRSKVYQIYIYMAHIFCSHFRLTFLSHHLSPSFIDCFVA